MKVREVVKRIEADDWVFARYGGRSSHRIYKKVGVQDEISISGPSSKEVSQVSFRIYGESQDCRCVEQGANK